MEIGYSHQTPRENISFRLLYSKITQLWQPIGEFDVLDLGYDYYLVKFDNYED